MESRPRLATRLRFRRCRFSPLTPYAVGTSSGDRMLVAEPRVLDENSDEDEDATWRWIGTFSPCCRLDIADPPKGTGGTVKLTDLVPAQRLGHSLSC